jgi:hypothetical protein
MPEIEEFYRVQSVYNIIAKVMHIHESNCMRLLVGEQEQ